MEWGEPGWAWHDEAWGGRPDERWAASGRRQWYAWGSGDAKKDDVRKGASSASSASEVDCPDVRLPRQVPRLRLRLKLPLM